MSIYDINGVELVTGKKEIIYPQSGVFNSCADVYTAYDAFVNASFATRTQIATVNSIPMYRYDFSAVNKWASGGDNAEDTSGEKLYKKKQALFFSGLHGDEKSAVLFLYEFMHHACYDPAFCWVFGVYDITIVPIGNPYGYNHNTRNNANNININRLDQSANTTEAIALKAVIDSQKWDLFIDHHNTGADQKTKNTGVSGAFSLANATPDAAKISVYEHFLSATTAITRSLRELWNMSDTNGVQNFLPWDGTTNQTFRQYGYTHSANGNTVGSPVSACNESSLYAYTYSGSTTIYNEKSLVVGATFVSAVILEMLDSVYKGFLGG